MIYEATPPPKYTNDSGHSIYLYSSHEVNKEFYDRLWPHAVYFSRQMDSKSSYTADAFLYIADLRDLLNAEDIKTAQRCLEHIAIAGLLPFVIELKGDGITFFKSSC